MKKITCLIIIPAIIFLFVNVASASFRGYSLEEMKKVSDTIIIGKVKGPIGEDFQYTIWRVQVVHYLKGKPTESNIKVRTFGAAQFHSSADYDLGPKNGYVLLFLKSKPDNIYITMSITGVVSLNRKFDGSFVINGRWQTDEMQKYIDRSIFYSPLSTYLIKGLSIAVLFLLALLSKKIKKSPV